MIEGQPRFFDASSQVVNCMHTFSVNDFIRLVSLYAQTAVLLLSPMPLVINVTRVAPSVT